MSKRQVLIFNRFERFWHWTQAAAIFVLLFTGFGIHGLHLGRFRHAGLDPRGCSTLPDGVVGIRGLLAPDDRQLAPLCANRERSVARRALLCIRHLPGRGSPYRKHFWRKHNPMQAVTYLALKVFLFPLSGCQGWPT